MTQFHQRPQSSPTGDLKLPKVFLLKEAPLAQHSYWLFIELSVLSEGQLPPHGCCSDYNNHSDHVSTTVAWEPPMVFTNSLTAFSLFLDKN